MAAATAAGDERKVTAATGGHSAAASRDVREEFQVYICSVNPRRL